VLLGVILQGIGVITDRERLNKDTNVPHQWTAAQVDIFPQISTDLLIF
jgi:hypothetical protein